MHARSQTVASSVKTATIAGRSADTAAITAAFTAPVMRSRRSQRRLRWSRMEPPSVVSSRTGPACVNRERVFSLGAFLWMMNESSPNLSSDKKAGEGRRTDEAIVVFVAQRLGDGLPRHEHCPVGVARPRRHRAETALPPVMQVWPPL